MSDLVPSGVPLGMLSKHDQQVVVSAEELARVTTELEAIRDLLRNIRETLVHMTTPAALAAIFQLDRPAR